METSLLLKLFLGLVFVLPAEMNIPLEIPFNHQKFAGLWFEVGLAANSPIYNPGEHKLKRGFLITPLHKNVKFSTFLDQSHTCVMEEKYGEQGLPGKFSFRKDNLEVTVLITNYTDYAIVYVSNVLIAEDKISAVILLYRSPSGVIPSAVMDDFKTISKFCGFPSYQIFLLNHMDHCAKILSEDRDRSQDQELCLSLEPSDQHLNCLHQPCLHLPRCSHLSLSDRHSIRCSWEWAG